MKPTLHPHAACTAICLAALLAFSSRVQAAPPDLTAAGAIAALKTDSSASPVYGQSYNLGATGLRGWIYINSTGSNIGQDGLMTDLSRQILVTVASAPGNAVLAVDDLILGAMGGSSGTVPLFSSDCRKAFGSAIGDAEKTGVGTLRVKRWRAGTTTDVNIPMTIMGNYADTAPYSCPKSALVLANARDQLVGQLSANPSFLSNDWSGAISGLALLASVAPGYVHPTLPTATYAYVQSRLQTFARALAPPTLTLTGCDTWGWGYIGVFLGEYYLRTVADGTPDTSVVAGLNTYTVALSKGQSRYGTFGHGGSLLNTDGSLHGTIPPYGPVNQAGIVANIAIVMGKKALLAAGQTIDPEIDPAIQRGGDFFAWYVNKGPIPYGEHQPFIAGHAPNGKDASCAVLFGLQATRTTETEYFTRMTTAGFTGREYGHTGQGFSYLWGAMGANMGGAAAVAAYLKPIRWHLDLERRTDGSFVYDGGEQYGAGSTSDGTYLGASGYYGMNPTASYILTYGLPLQRLNITGKNAIPANTLDSTEVAAAIAAATFDVDCHGFTTTQLITSLSDFDPCVRYYAATELGTRTLGSTDLTTLRTMVGDTTNANGRQGACQTLGLLQDATALPLLTQHLDKTIEPDSWVRAKAASAIRMYTPATASTQRDPMLTAFAANATDPNVIVWDDPIQISNNYLNFALFGDAVAGGNNIATYSINAAKSLLYPAVQAGLKQPDSNSRFGTANFCYNYLTLADAQALIPDLLQVVETESQADTMWSMDPRGSGIATLAKYKITEGIPEALNMLVVPTGFGWGCDGFQIPGLNALAAYGDAARWTLPTLQGYLGTWYPLSSTYTTLVSTIASIQAAITSPTQNLGLAVANPQVVATTAAKAITLTGTSPRSAVAFTNVTAPAHGTLTGIAPNLTYTPTGGYTGPDYFTFQVTDSLSTSAPGTVSVIVGTAGTGLKGEYYDNVNFTNLKVTRTDAQVNFDWGTGSPDPSIGADTFSVRWSGLLLVPETGTYKFSTLNSDGVRLYINGALVIDDYVDQTTNWTDGASVNLTAGQLVDLQLEYYENTGSAVAKLKWTGPSFAGTNGAIIGTPWLYDGTGVTRTPYAHDQSLSLVQNTVQAITLTGSGGTLTYAVLTQPAHGALTGAAPNLTYTPAANYSGTDSFTFLVNNGTGNSTPATVSISIWAGLPVTYTWSAATAGNWSLGTNWTGGAAPAVAGQPYYSLNFTPSGTYTVTDDLNNGFQLNQLNTGGAVTIAGTNSLAFTANGTLLPQFNQTSSDAVTINTLLNLSAMTTFGGSGGGDVTINSLISGSGGLTKNTPGVLMINNINNTYSGGTVLNAGTVTFPVSGTVTPFFGTGPVTINSNATLSVNRTYLTNSIFLNGATVTGGNGFGSTLSGPVTLNGITTFDFGTTGGINILGNISGTGGLTTVGTTQWSLSGFNSYTGPTTIQAGSLSYNTAAAVPPGALNISSGAFAKLNYSGTRVIAALAIGGTTMPPGTYGSSSSPAANKNDSYFSGTGTVTILPATTTALALTAGSTPAIPGTSLTFTATVTGNAPTGNVAFYAGATLLGTGTVNGSYQASLTTSSLAIGSYTITARYAGNATNATSTSAPLTIVVASNLAPSPGNLLAAPGNNHVALSWTVSVGATSYHVKRSLANGGPYTVIGSSATAGYDDLTAANGTTYYYVVSAINAVGESSNSSQVSVIPAIQPSATAVVSSPVGTGPYGSTVTFTATVTVSGAFATGTVTFKDGATVIGTGTLDGTGTASCTTSALAAASHSITATYVGDATYAVSVSAPAAYAVTPLALTLSGVTTSNKIYDSGAIAVLTGGALSGVITGDTVTVVPGSGTFASPNVGTWAITATGYSLGGTNAGNYVLSAQPTVSNATITPKSLTLSATPAVTGKTYDGLTAATLTGATLQGAEAVGTGSTGDGKPYTGDTVAVTLSGTFSTKDAGTGKAVTSTSTLTGAQAGDYTLTQPVGLTGIIAPKALALSATPAVTGKTYDGLTAATLTGSTLQGAEAAGAGSTGDGKPYSGDTVAVTLSGTFNTKDAGSGKAVTSTSTLSGAQAGDYSLTQPTGLTGTITPAALTVTAGNQRKTYGQTLVFGSGATLFTSSGLQNGEMIGSVTLACAGGAAAAAVGSYPITPGAATGGTFNAGNYSIGYVPGTLTVSATNQTITKAATGTDLTAGASWGGTAPGSSDLASWAATSLGTGLTLGSSSSWGGMGVAGAASAIAVTGVGPLTLGAGGIDMSVATVNLTWGTPITLGTSQTWNVNSGMTLAASGIISGTGMGLTKAGLGTVTLNGSAVHTFTGGLIVNPGGTLTLDLRNLATPTNLVNNGNVLTLAGGELNLTGKGSAVTSQSFASTTLNNGGSTVTLNRNSATSLTGALGAITRNAGGTLLFSTVPNTSTTIATTATGNEGGGILAPWAAVGATTAMQYAANNGSGQIISYAGATTTASPANLSDVSSASVNYAFGATASPTLTGAITANTLRFTGAAGVLTTSGKNITLNSLMNAGSGSLDIGVSGGTNGNLVVGANKELVFWTGGQAINIYSPIVDNGGGASSVVFGGNNPPQCTLNANVLSYTGSTTVNLGYGGTSGRLKVVGASGTWSYTGDMTINGGMVWLQGSAFAGGGSFTVGNITVNAGGIIMGDRGNFVAKTGCALTLNGGTWNETNGFGGSWTGPVYLTADATIDSGFQQTVTGVISGSFGFTKKSSGTLILNSSNTYSGNTNISAGVLQIGASGAINNSPRITIGAGATFDVSLITSPYTWSGSTTLAAVGTASAATFKGKSGGTINMGSQPIVLAYDGSHAALTVSQGTLSLNANPITVNGSTLPPGAYNIVSQTTGSISSSGTYPGVNGTAIPAGKIGYITTSGTTPGLVTLNIGAPTLTVSGFPGTETAGTAATVTVTAKDPNGNTATAYTGTVTFSSSDAQAVLPSSYTFVPSDNGTHTFCVTLKTVASQSITATDSLAGASASQTGITVTAAAAASLVVSGFPNPTTAGATGGVTVTAKDAYGNTATGYVGTIHFTSSDGSVSLPSDYTFLGGDNGTHTFTATLNTVSPPNVSITATDTVTGTITGSQTGIVVNPSTIASYLTVTGLPSPSTAGTANSVTVTAKLVGGATATAYTGTIHFTSTDGAAVLPINYTFVAGDNGVHTFTGGVTLKTAGTQSVTATDTVTAITGTQGGITVGSAAAATLTVAGFPSPEWVGTAGGVTVTAHDAYGNIATGYTGTVHFTSSDGAATLPSDYTFVSGDNGAHTFTGGVTFSAAGTQSITAADTAAGTITGTQSGITVNLVPSVFTWKNAAAGTWIDAANWTNDAGVVAAPDIAGKANYTLNFTIAGTYTATDNVSAGFLLNQLNLTGATVAGNSLHFTNNIAAPPQINQSTAAVGSINNDITLGADTIVGVTGGGLALNGLISGTGGLLKTGGGTLTVTNNSNTFSGAMTVQAGSVSVASLNSVSGGTASSNLGAPTTVANGMIALGLGASAATLYYHGTGETTDRVLNLSGTTGGATVEQAGASGLLKFTSALTASGAGAKTLTLQGSTAGTGELGGAIVDSSGGATALVKTGTGTWTLSGSNSYTGTTAVNGGTLLISGTNSGPGAVTVASTATLGGTGALGGNVTYAGGALAKFTQGSPLAISGTLTLNDNVVHVVLPADLAGGTYTLATYLASGSTGSFNATPVIDSGSLVTGATASVTTGSGFVKLVVSGGNPYDLWSGSALFDADANGDGVSNGLAWLLGAASKDANATSLLPMPGATSGNLVLAFDCLSAADRGTAVLNLQYSNDLGISDPWGSHEVAVPGMIGTSTVGGVNFTATANGTLIHVVAEVPASAASPGTKLFSRLQANQP